jgi:biotin operon repressor
MRDYTRDFREHEAHERRNGRPPKLDVRPPRLEDMRPVRYAWKPWLVDGRLNLMVGEEKVGKSTFSAWIAAGITTGTLSGQPGDVLFVGADEDDWNSVTLPRLYAAGADLDRVRELYALDDTVMFEVERDRGELARLLDERHYALVVFEHLMDILPALRNYNDPAAIRRALAPLRRVLAARETTGLGTLHVNKAPATSFRERAQGSVQYIAQARSTFLIAEHPHDKLRRVAVLGPSNYAGGNHALAFSIAEAVFAHGEHVFEVGRVVDVEASDVGMADVLGAADSREAERDGRRERVLDALTDEPQAERPLADALGIPRATLQRDLKSLEERNLAVRRIDGSGWVRVGL